MTKYNSWQWKKWWMANLGRILSGIITSGITLLIVYFADKLK